MALKNEQYDRIFREYDKRQLDNRHLLQDKQQEVYSQIPALKELDDAIASNAVKAMKLTLSGDEGALEQLRHDNLDLSENKQQLLMAHGYPMDYLSPSYTCPDCKDTGYITHTDWQDEDHLLLSNNKCHCFKQAVVDILYQQSNIRAAIEKENFSTFSFDYFDATTVDETTGLTAQQNISEMLNTCQRFVQEFDEKFDNLLLYGSAGTGKTFLSNCIAKELIESGHTVIYLTASQLFDILEQHKFNHNDVQVEEQFQGIMDCELLIIDDLGTELSNTFTNTQLYVCINERMLSERSTIISTNLPLEDLTSFYSERIVSRLLSQYKMMKLFGQDIRIQKAFRRSQDSMF